VGAIAAREIGGLAHLVGAVATSEPRHDAGVRLLEPQELDATLDLHAGGGQALDDHALVLILGEDQHERERAQPDARAAERRACGAPPRHPQVHGVEMPAVVDQRVGEADLPIELERARLHHERPRGGTRLGGLVDDPDLNASEVTNVEYSASVGKFTADSSTPFPSGSR
jgi:hypothetical protein